MHFTEAVNGCIQESVMAMRKQMFTENQTECAIFIGGMNGILDEYNMLHSMYPKAKFYAFASTGGASIELYKKIGEHNELLENSYAYISIFRELLLPYKNNDYVRHS